MKEKEENIIKETEINHITNDKISSLEKDLIASNAELEKQSKLISDLRNAYYEANLKQTDETIFILFQMINYHKMLKH